MQGGEWDSSVELLSECAPISPGLPRPLAHSSPAYLELRKESELGGSPTDWLSGNSGSFPPRLLVRMTSMYSDGGSDDSSELPTPYKEDVTLEAEPEEVDKLDRMLSLLREEEGEDPSGMLPDVEQAARSKDDMYLLVPRFKSWSRQYCFPRRRAMSCSFPSITEEDEEGGADRSNDQTGGKDLVQTGAQDEQSSGLKGGPVGRLYMHDVKDLISIASPHSTGNGIQGHGNPMLTTARHGSWGHPCRSRNAILLDILGDSSGSESDQSAARRMVWRQTQSLHSVSSSEDGGVLSLLGSRNEMDAEELLISLGFCDFDSPELIPDRLIPDSVAHARPSVMAQEAVDEEPPLCHVETTNEIPEELELSLPLGATAEDVCLHGLVQQVKGRVRSTLPIPISALPDTPYYPFHGQPLDTVMEETDSQLSPVSGSPRLSPHASLDHTSSDSKPAAGNLLSVPQLHRPSLPSMTPSREGYKLGVELPSRDGCKLSMESAARDVRRLSMDSHHSFQSADTIYFSVTSYDDAPDQPGGCVEGSCARSRSGSRSPSPRARRKAVATPPPPTTVLKWLNSQMDEGIIEEDQPWPFSELLSQESETDGGPEGAEGHRLDLTIMGPDEGSTLLTPSESSGSFVSCQADFVEDSGSSSDAADSSSLSRANLAHRFSQASTVVEPDDGSGMHRASSASTITLSSSLHRLSGGSSIMMTRGHSGSPHREQVVMSLSRRRSSLYNSEPRRTPPPNVEEAEDMCPQSGSRRDGQMLQADPSPLETVVCQKPMPMSVEHQLVQTTACPTSNCTTVSTEDLGTPKTDTPSSRQPVANCMPPNEAATRPREAATHPNEAATPPHEAATHPREAATPPNESEVLADIGVTLPSGTAWDEPSQVFGCVVRTTIRSSSPHRQPTDHVAKQPATEEPLQLEGPPSHVAQAEEKIPQTVPSEKYLGTESNDIGLQVKSEPVSQVSQLTGQVALLREVVEQKDSTIDKLIHSHGIEAGELRKQVEHFKQQVAETKESLCARLAAVEEERDSLSLQVREANTRHKSQLAGTKQQFKRRTSEELFDLKAKLNREKQAELSKVCAKAQRDIDDLKQQLASKGQEIARVKSFAHEREGAADALAEELQQLRKESLDREAKLKEALQSEARRAEKQLAREKALAVVKTQEAAAANHQRELMEVKDHLMEEKQSALAEQRQQHAAQLEELTRKVQVREEEKRSLLLQLEESRQSVAVAREEASRQLKQQLHEMRGALESERQQNRSLVAEKQAAMARAREAARQSLEEDMSILQARLEREHRSEVDRLQEKLARAEGEVLRRRGREQELQQREKELAVQLEDEEMELMRSVSEECQRVALLLGRRHSRHLPPGSTGPRAPELLPSNRMSAVSLLCNSVEDLRVHVSELKQQADKDRAAVAKAHKEKAVELRQLRTELQIDKSHALKAQEERLSREAKAGRLSLGPAVEQASKGCQAVGSGKDTPPDMEIAQLEASLKEEVQRGERLRALLGERAKECSTLQQQLKQLSKEHLVLQKEVNSRT